MNWQEMIFKDKKTLINFDKIKYITYDEKENKTCIYFGINDYMISKGLDLYNAIIESLNVKEINRGEQVIRRTE